MYRVLSIDWDYFCEASASQRYMLFPDGGNENISLDLSNYIWMNRYEIPELFSIKVKKQQVAMVSSYLKNLNNDESYMIAESHRHAYDFIKASVPNFSEQNIEITNIDFHHDMYDFGDNEVNCGNWLKKLIDENNNIKVKWVCQDDSSADGMEDPNKNVTIVRKKLGSVLRDKYDLIYICRSNIWSPPHLDKYFNKAFEWIIETKPTRLQQGIFKPRM